MLNQVLYRHYFGYGVDQDQLAPGRSADQDHYDHKPILKITNRYLKIGK